MKDGLICIASTYFVWWKTQQANIRDQQRHLGAEFRSYPGFRNLFLFSFFWAKMSQSRQKLDAGSEKLENEKPSRCISNQTRENKMASSFISTVKILEAEILEDSVLRLHDEVQPRRVGRIPVA